MNTNFEIIATQISDKQLLDATNTIVTAINATVRCYFTIGETLAKINEEKLYKTAFGTFDEYTNSVFGISKSTAYRMINVTRKFLTPELALPYNQKIFSPFEDTALAALNPIGDYDSTVDFINENGITPQTPVSEIRKAVKRFQDDRAETVTEIETECEETEPEETEEITPISELDKLIMSLKICAHELEPERKKPKSKRLKKPLKALLISVGYLLDYFDISNKEIKVLTDMIDHTNN